MNPVEVFHRDVDQLLDLVRKANPEFKPPCCVGCHACCDESLYTSDIEADYVLSILSLPARERLKVALPVWVAKAKPLLHQRQPDAVEWRKLEATCPLLAADGLCSIYPNRPMGCRVFFARGEAANCALPFREHQKFAIFPGGMFVGPLVALAATVKKNVLDHLAAHLYRRLIGPLRSGSREIFKAK